MLEHIKECFRVDRSTINMIEQAVVAYMAFIISTTSYTLPEDTIMPLWNEARVALTNTSLKRGNLKIPPAKNGKENRIERLLRICNFFIYDLVESCYWINYCSRLPLTIARASSPGTNYDKKLKKLIGRMKTMVNSLNQELQNYLTRLIPVDIDPKLNMVQDYLIFCSSIACLNRSSKNIVDSIKSKLNGKPVAFILKNGKTFPLEKMNDDYNRLLKEIARLFLRRCI